MRIPKKVPEKASGGFGAEPGQVQQGSGKVSGEGLGGFGAARSGSTGFQRRFQHLAWQHASESKTLRLLGIPPKLIFCEGEVEVVTRLFGAMVALRHGPIAWNSARSLESHSHPVSFE